MSVKAAAPAALPERKLRREGLFICVASVVSISVSRSTGLLTVTRGIGLPACLCGTGLPTCASLHRVVGRYRHVVAILNAAASSTMELTNADLGERNRDEANDEQRQRHN